jgi:hypothetical protein
MGSTDKNRREKTKYRAGSIFNPLLAHRYTNKPWNRRKSTPRNTGTATLASKPEVELNPARRPQQ